jgi:TolB protein
MTKFYVLILSFLLTSSVSAQLVIGAVGEAELETSKFLLEMPNLAAGLSTAESKASQEFISIIKNNFSFYKKKFNTLDSVKANGFSKPNMIGLKGKSVSFYTQVKITKTSILNYELETYNVNTGKKIVSEKGTLPLTKVREVAHQVADYIYQSIMKKRSIFQSKILFVSDRTGSRKNPKKELYIMDFDGNKRKQLTFHGGTVISPAISKDRSRVLYSLIRNLSQKRKRNINLRMLDLKTGEDTLVSQRKGINSGAVFMPNDENKIVLTLSHSGNAELYVMDLRSRSLKRLTKHYSPDVDPSISVDGSRMTFLSGRPGAAMIYTSYTSGLEKSVKRISFVGKYNATPRFSPDGREIAFSSWLDNRFDIFRIDADGNNLSRLTKDFGSNEDPSYSNDGQFVAFSSQRVLSRTKAVQNIYIMDRDGEILGSVTKGFGNCITPRWTK